MRLEKNNRLVILGAGQQGRVCKVVAEDNGYKVVAFVDDFKTGEVEGVPVYSSVEDIEDFQNLRYIAAIGNVGPRKRLRYVLTKYKLRTVNLIDKHAIIEPGAKIGNGNFIGKNAIIYASAKIGSDNIINCKAVIATDAVVGDNCNVSLGCNICGGVHVGDNCYIGCQASVVSGVKIGNGATIGAGAVVLHDVEDGSFVAGVPAVKRQRSQK